MNPIASQARFEFALVICSSTSSGDMHSPAESLVDLRTSRQSQAAGGQWADRHVHCLGLATNLNSVAKSTTLHTTPLITVLGGCPRYRLGLLLQKHPV